MSRMKMMVAIAGAGLVIALGGLVYGVLTVGVPYQDATAAQAAAESMNLAISCWSMGGGILMLLAAGGGLVMLGAARLMRPRS